MIYLLTSSDGEWTITAEGLEVPVAAFSDPGVALNAARGLALFRQGRVWVFHIDGRIEEVWNQNVSQ